MIPDELGWSSFGDRPRVLLLICGLHVQDDITDLDVECADSR